MPSKLINQMTYVLPTKKGEAPVINMEEDIQGVKLK